MSFVDFMQLALWEALPVTMVFVLMPLFLFSQYDGFFDD